VAVQVYDIVILGFEQHADAVRGLTRVFGIDEPTARSIVARVPIVVRRSVNDEQARPYEKALISIGARVQVRAVASERDGVGAVVQAPPSESQAQPSPLSAAKTLADGIPRARRAAHVETELMHSGGWQFGDVAPPTQAPGWSAPVSLRPPAQAAASLPAPAYSFPSSRPPAEHIAASLPAPAYVPSLPPDAALELESVAPRRSPPPPSDWLESRLDPGQSLPVSAAPQAPGAPDTKARTTRFAADLVLPWVGGEPEPPRPIMQRSRGPK